MMKILGKHLNKLKFIQDRPFHSFPRTGRRQKGPPSLKSVTLSTMMKVGTVIPYLKKIPKIYESRDTPLEFC